MFKSTKKVYLSANALNSLIGYENASKWKSTPVIIMVLV